MARAAAAVVAAATTPLLPAWAAACAAHPRLRRDLLARFGLSVPALAPGVVWVHAASVGEVGAAEALVAYLPGRVLLTADTDTGVERARAIAAASGGRVVAAIRPVDHPWTLAPLWAESRPRAVVLVEGTYWPQLAARCASAGVPLLRVSAKAGDRTRRLARRWWYAVVTAPTTRVVCRDDDEAAWFRAVGGAPVAVAGDLKGARAVADNPLTWSRPFVVGASTRGEEVALVEACAALDDRPALLLAPRHRERFDGVIAALAERGVPFVARTSLVDGRVPADVDVVVLDTIGELAGCLVGAAAAVVGGTFDPAIGGHSPLEAFVAGVPVVAGPHRSANEAAFEQGPVVAAEAATGGALARALAAARGMQVPAVGADAAVSTARWVVQDLGTPAPEAAPRPWALVGAVAYAATSAVHHRAFSLGLRRVARVDVPVVSVGSTNARGSGKTPTARWMADELRRRGHTVGIAVRGYRRRRGGADVRVSDQTRSADDLGDEGALHALAGYLVAAAPDRVACARALVDRGVTVVVLDDGLQHRRLHRDVDLVVLDARNPHARGLIPLGERREWDTVPPRATGAIVHHGPLGWETGVPTAVATRTPGPWHRDGCVVEAPEGPVVAFAGVARPGDVLASLDDLQVAVFRPLEDHQPIGSELVRELLAVAAGRPLVCTAKDAVRLPPEVATQVYWRDVSVRVPSAPESWFVPVPSTGPKV